MGFFFVLGKKVEHWRSAYFILGEAAQPPRLLESPALKPHRVEVESGLEDEGAPTDKQAFELCRHQSGRDVDFKLRAAFA